MVGETKGSLMGCSACLLVSNKLDIKIINDKKRDGDWWSHGVFVQAGSVSGRREVVGCCGKVFDEVVFIAGNDTAGLAGVIHIMTCLCRF
jgi:hypothetical protein